MNLFDILNLNLHEFMNYVLCGRDSYELCKRPLRIYNSLVFKAQSIELSCFFNDHPKNTNVQFMGTSFPLGEKLKWEIFNREE